MALAFVLGNRTCPQKKGLPIIWLFEVRNMEQGKCSRMY